MRKGQAAPVSDRVFAMLEQRGPAGHVISPVDRLTDTLGFDSLDVIELTIDLETEFQINIPDDVMNRWMTDAAEAREVVAYICERTRGEVADG